jgi:isopenicillin N synthase-like dioxygenase
MTLPIVDFAASPDPGAEIDAGLSAFGFLQLSHIGIEPSELEAVFDAADAFFRTSSEEKNRCAYRSAVENFGYQGLLEENLDPGAPADLKQTFTMRNIVNDCAPVERWPSPEFRDLMRAFFAHALDCAHEVQRRMADTLALPPEFFTRVHTGENVTLRLLNYPAGAAPIIDAAQLGAGAHTDYGFITLLFQHGVAGLQVVGPEGEWIDVPPRAGAVVVNSGDLLERWSNGKYKSTRHRVIANTGLRDRLSIAVFLDPDSDALVETLPSCVSADNPAKFGPISAGAHLQFKLEASHKGRFAS